MRERVDYQTYEQSLKDSNLYRTPPFIVRLGFYSLYPATFPHYGEHCQSKVWIVPTEEEKQACIKWIKKHYPDAAREFKI